MSFEERMEYVLRSIESHDRQIGELFDGLAQQKVNIDALTRNVKTLVEVSNRDAVDILRLANIADNHEKRTDRIEGGPE
jgi:hypothetical protein